MRPRACPCRCALQAAHARRELRSVACAPYNMNMACVVPGVARKRGLRCPLGRTTHPRTRGTPADVKHAAGCQSETRVCTGRGQCEKTSLFVFLYIVAGQRSNTKAISWIRRSRPAKGSETTISRVMGLYAASQIAASLDPCSSLLTHPRVFPPGITHTLLATGLRAALTRAPRKPYQQAFRHVHGTARRAAEVARLPCSCLGYGL
eukprot:3397182-Rhodomonas_salina.2